MDDGNAQVPVVLRWLGELAKTTCLQTLPLVQQSRIKTKRLSFENMRILRDAKGRQGSFYVPQNSCFSCLNHVKTDAFNRKDRTLMG